MNSNINKLNLTYLPTPLEPANKLAKYIGLDSLFIKRDDLTGLAGGGNKARKLEFDFAEIIKGGYDVVITAGGIQSNHARMTAAASHKLGLETKLVLGGPDFKVPKGNLLLDVLFNAQIRFLVDDDANSSLENEMKNWADELLGEGRRPFIIPIGGSTGLGAVGYVEAMRELAAQIQTDSIQIIVGVGSCGTFAGTILGSRIFLPGSRVIGISVSRTSDEIRKRTQELITECAALIDYKIGDELSIECYDNYHKEYGVITESGKHAIELAANLEGILLDPIYTGKVMAGLMDLTVNKVIEKNTPVVFVHTGGMPILFSFEKDLSSKMNCIKIYK